MNSRRTPTLLVAFFVITLPTTAVVPDVAQGSLAEPSPASSSDGSVATEPVGPISLQDALTLALMHNPELESFDWGVRISEARSLQAGKIPNPELDFRLYRLGVPRLGATDESERKRVVVNQVFELGGKRRKRVAVAAAERRLAGLDHESRRRLLEAEVARRFAAVLGAQLRVQSWTEAVTRFEQIQEKATRLVETGALGRLASQRSARQTAIGRIELERAKSELSTARFALVATWSGRSEDVGTAVGDLKRIAPIPTFETVVELAAQSPDAQRWDAELGRRQAQLDLAKSGRVPDLSYGAGMRWESDFDQRDYLIDLEFELPIFDRKQGEIREARHRIAQTEARRRATGAANSARIAEKYFVMMESRSRSLTFAEDIVPASSATFDAYASAFELQGIGLDELLGACSDLAHDKSDYAVALEDYHRSLADLEETLGRSLSSAQSKPEPD